jgi:uncharacterized MAPEG superfamily protein
MPIDVRLLAYAAVLAWIMILTASFLRSGGDLRLMFGNRGEMPAPGALSGRADRAAANMLENLILFVALLVAAHGAGASQDRLTLGARLFFYGRLAYFPVYLLGVRYLRTTLWLVSVAGMGVLLASVL